MTAAPAPRRTLPRGGVCVALRTARRPEQNLQTGYLGTKDIVRDILGKGFLWLQTGVITLLRETTAVA